jgi:hypothetical protein
VTRSACLMLLLPLVWHFPTLHTVMLLTCPNHYDWKRKNFPVSVTGTSSIVSLDDLLFQTKLHVPNTYDTRVISGEGKSRSISSRCVWIEYQFPSHIWLRSLTIKPALYISHVNFNNSDLCKLAVDDRAFLSVFFMKLSPLKKGVKCI